MTNYKHGISTTRDADISIEVSEAARVHAVIGTAPINLLDDPEKSGKYTISGKKTEEK